MNNNNDDQLLFFFRYIAIPLGMIFSLLGVGFFTYILIVHHSEIKSAFDFLPLLMCVGGSYMFFWYLRTKLGWFQRKKK